MTKTERSILTSLKGWLRKAGEMQKKCEKITSTDAAAEARYLLAAIKTETGKIKIKAGK